MQPVNHGPSVGHSEISDQLFSTFVGPNAVFYMDQFSKFRLLGDNFTVTWNWPAFFVPQIWLFYRKMYLFGLIALVLSAFAVVGWVVAGIAMGVSGNYLYYIHAKKKLLDLQTTSDPANLMQTAQMLGGTEPRIVWIIVIITIVAFLLFSASVFTIIKGLFLFGHPFPIQV